MFYAQQKMGWFIDWQKVCNLLQNEYNILSANYYVGLKQKDEKMANFIKKLKAYDFKVITKPLKKIYVPLSERSQAKRVGNFIYKANFDVEIGCDIVTVDKRIDTIILFSGDSDFAYALKLVRNRAIKSRVYATKQTLSRELRLSCPKYVLLENIKNEIQYTKTPA